jgi:chromosome segregation ATPase
VKALNGRINTTNERINTTNERLDTTNERVDKVETGLSELRDEVRTGFAALREQQVQTEIRLASELVAVVGAVRDVGDLLRADRDERKRIDALEERVGRLERKVG